MKARVKTYLNERTIQPSVNAPNYSYYKPGDEIEITDIVNGDSYDGNNVWYQLKNGSYVWSGGVEGLKSIDSDIGLVLNKEKSNKDWYHSKYGITKIWEEYNKYGEDVNIAIVDSGIHVDNMYFENANIDGVRWDGNKDYIDQNGHGTKVASIIAANGPTLIGVAPKTNLFICKYYDRQPEVPQLLEALDHIPEKVDFIVISSGFLPQDLTAEQTKLLEDKIIRLSRTKLVICSVGDDYNHDDNPFIRYPAGFTSVISVASVNDQNYISEFSTKSNKIELAAPGEKVKVYDFQNQKIATEDGTSFSSPFVAGVLALIKSSYPHLTSQELIDIILKTLKSKTSKSLYGGGIIDPLAATQKIKNQQV